MKIEIEITDEEAACIFDDYHAKTPSELSGIIASMAKDVAVKYRRIFPSEVLKAVERFAKALNEHPPTRRI